MYAAGSGVSVRAFKLRSPAFGPGGEIPPKYTCDGSDVSPPLRWTEPPQGTTGFALIVAGVATQGLNDFGGTGYDAPCPPRGPAHRYLFRLYALDSALALPPYKTKGDLLKACSAPLLAGVELPGRYKRKEP